MRARSFYLSAVAALLIAQVALAAGPTITIPNGNLGAYSFGTVQIPLRSTGGTGAVTWTVTAGALPPGLAIRTDGTSFFPGDATGSLMGVATTKGHYSFTLTATDTANPGVDFPATIDITDEYVDETFSLPDGAKGIAYSHQINAVHGTAPSFSITGGNLPGTFNLSSGGLLTGTPTVAGAYNFTVQISDSGLTFYRSFNLTVAGPTISTASIQTAAQGASVNLTFAGTGGAGGPYTFQQTGGNLPNGVSFNNATGTLSGTVNPNANAGRYSFGVKVTDSSGSYTQNFAFYVISSSSPLPNIQNGVLPDGSIGNPYNASVSGNSGKGPYSWNVTGLPSGLSFRTQGISSFIAPGDVEIRGVPQQSGDFNVTFTATDQNNAAVTQVLKLHISTLAVTTNLTLPTGVLNSAYTQQTLQVIGGTPGYTTLLLGPQFPQNGISVSGGGPTSFTISGTPTETGQFNFPIRLSDTGGASLSVTVNLSVQGSGNIVINNNSNLGTFTTSSNVNIQLNACCVNGSQFVWTNPGNGLPSGLSLDQSTGALTGTATPQGAYSFRIRATDANSGNSSNFGEKIFSIGFSDLAITTASLPFGNVGTPYNFTITTSGGNQSSLSWFNPTSLLPPGVSYSNGVFSGTPLYSGQYNFTIGVSDGNNFVQKNFQITIYAAGGGPPVVITDSGSMGTYPLGDFDYDLSGAATGGNGSYTWSLQNGSSLPPGIALRTDLSDVGQTIALAGVAQTSGTYSFTLVATSGAQSASKQFTVKITALNVVDGFNLPDAYDGTAYSYTLTPINNAGNVTYSLNPSGGTPPAWVNFSQLANGIVSGTPTGVSSSTFGIAINDGTDSVTRYFNLNTNKIHILTTPAQLPNALQGQTYSVTLSSTGGTGNVTFTASGLPNGLQISNGNLITGTVDSNAFPGLYPINITATDSSQPNPVSITQTFAINVTATSPRLPQISFGYADDAVVGQFYSWTINACCGGAGPFTWSATGLPTGLFLRYAGGGVSGTASASPSSYVAPGAVEIYGIAKTPGNYPVSLTLTDALAQTTRVDFSLRVSVLDIQPGMPNGTLGVSYSVKQHILGGTASPSYTGGSSAPPGGPLDYYAYAGGNIAGGWAAELAGLPDGLTVSVAGNPPVRTTSGVPLESGSFSPIYSVTDGTNSLVRTNYFNINNPQGVTVTINTNANLGGTGLVSYSNQLIAFGAASITWSAVPGTLPPGLTLSADGLLSGTPTTPGNYSFLITAKDSGNASNAASRAFTLVVTSLTITTGSLPSGSLTNAYSASVAATGGTGTLHWVTGTGSRLPPGLVLNDDGTITGTPTSMGQYYTTFTVKDSADPNFPNKTSKGLVIQIYGAAGVPVSISTGQHLGTWSVGEIQYELDATGGNGSYIWTKTAGTLPPGFSIRTDMPAWFTQNASAGLIGVATTPGNYSFTLQATSGQQSATRQFDITIVPLTMKDPFMLADAYVGNSYSYTLTPLNAAQGATLTFSTTQATCNGGTACLPPGLALSSGGAITGTPTTAGTYSFNVSLSDGTSTVSRQYNIQTYAIDITTPSLPNAIQGTAYDSGAMTSTGGGTLTWAATGLPGGFSISSSTGAITAPSSVPVGAGRYSVTVTVTATDQSTSTSSIRRYLLNVVGTPAALPQLTLNGSYLDDATIGFPYDATFAVTNGGTAPFTYSATGLPAGMSIRSAIPTQSNQSTAGDAEIWGVATATGTFSVTITATDANNVVTANTFPLTVSALIQDPGLPKGTVGTAYNANLRIVGGSGSYSVTKTLAGRLPGGLTRNALNVAGTPTESGNFNVTYSFTDTATPTANTLAHTNYMQVDNTLNNPVGINDSGDLGTVSLNSPYTRTLTACCNPNGFTWAVASGALPHGLTLNGGGVLSGKPDTIGTYTFLVSATATGGSNVAYRQFYMTVTPIVVSNTNLPFGTVGATYTQSISTNLLTGATAPVTWALNPGSYLPPGIQLLQGGTLTSGSNNLTIAGHFSFTLTGTDSAQPANVVVRTFSLDVYPAGSGPPLNFTLNSSYGPWILGPNSIALSATGGTPPYTFSYAPEANTIPGCRVQNGGPMPTALSQGTSAALLCVANTTGTTNTTIRVTDSANAQIDRATTITVSPLMLEMQSTLPRATLNSPYTYNPVAGGGVAALGGTGAYTFSATGLPNGLLIDSSTGVISGTPTQSGGFTPSITVGNASVTGTISINVTLNVNDFAITSSNSLQGTAGQSFTANLTAPNCPGTCNWSIQNGILPNWLTLNNSTGALSSGNNVAAPVDMSFTVQASGTSGQTTLTSQQVISLVVAPNAITALSITTTQAETIPLGGSTAIGLFAAGGKPPYMFSVSAGTLPPGITLQGTGDQIGFLAPNHQYLAGRAVFPSTFNFTLQVTDSSTPTAKTATQDYSLVVSPLSLQYTNLPLGGANLTINTPYSQQLLVMGGTGVYSGWTNQTPLQTGLTLSGTGLLSGTPTTTGQITSLISVHDDQGATVATNLNMKVTSSGGTTISLGGPAPGTVQPLGIAQNYFLNPTGGVQPYTISAVGPLPAGVILESGNALSSTVQGTAPIMQATFSAPGTYTFTVQATDSTQPAPLVGARTYTIVVPNFAPPLQPSTTLPPGSVNVAYSQQLYSFGAGTWSVSTGSALPPGLSISGGGLISGTPSAPGVYAFNLSIGDVSGSNSQSYTMQISPLAISSAQSLPPASISRPYGPVSLTGSGGSGTTTWVVSSGSLPDGLTLSSAGQISGTPTGEGVNGINGIYVFTITASNSSGSISKVFSMFQTQPNPLNLDFSISQTSLPDAVLGQNYIWTLTPDGGVADYTWTVANGSSLPPGLQLVPATSVTTNAGPGITAIAGAPTAAGAYTFSLVLTDSTSATITRTFSLKVTPLSITSGNPRNAVQGTPYSFQFQATGGTGPYTYSISPNPNQIGQDLLPTGLTLSSGGLLSGTPTSTGGFQFWLTVTDSAQHSLTRSLTIQCNTTGGEQILTQNQFFQINKGINIPLSVGGSQAAFDWSLQTQNPAPPSPIQANLPAGVQLVSSQDGTAVIQGPALAPGTYQVMLKAANHGNPADFVMRQLTFTITPITMTSPVQNGLFSPSIPNATQGTAYSFTFTAAGGTAPYTFTEALNAPLPPGLTLSSAGVLSGTPTQSGVFAIRPRVTDSASNPADVNFSVTMIVTAPGGKAPLNLRSNANFSTPSLNVPYAIPLDRLVFPANGVLSFSLSAGSLPPGLSVVPGSNGLPSLLAGTPTSLTPSPFTVHIADTSGQSLDVPVDDFSVSPIAFSPDWIPNAVKGTSYSTFITVGGGTAPYKIDLVSGTALPPGLTVNNNGLLSGIPTYSGTFPIGLKATDKNNITVTKFYDFSVDDSDGGAPSISLAPKPVQVLEIQGQSATSTSVSVSASSGTKSYAAALYSLPGSVSLTSPTGTTAGSVGIDYSGLTPGNYSGFLAVASPNAVNYADVTPVSISVVTPPPCAYSIKTSSTSSPINGDSGTIEISTGDNCAWTAAPADDSSWITLTGTVSGTGNGKVSYTTAANNSETERTGTVTITGSTNSPVFTIKQFSNACSFSLSPSSISIGSGAGTATVKIVASGASCNWGTGVELTVAPTSGVGSGSVDVTFPANTNATPAVLTATIAGQTFTINQAAATCAYLLSSKSSLFDSSGGSGSVDITATNGCPYNTILGPSWINVTSGASGTGTGNPQSLLYTVDANSTTSPRTGALLIGGQAYAITEQALTCSVSVDTSQLGSPFPSGGGSGIIGITTNGPNCPWRASTNSGFAQVIPAAGFGSTNLTVNVNSNIGSPTPRPGSVVVSGQTINFTQAGTSCTYVLRSTGSNMPAIGGGSNVTVVAPSACNWDATSNDSWLKITAKGTNGTADVSFTADANTAATPRTGTLTVAGQTFTVAQGGAPCTYTLASSSSATLDSVSNSGLTVNYTASAASCAAPAVASFSNWIAASSTSYNAPNGTMTYSILANTAGSQRTGNIQVGDKVYRVTQAAPPGNCAYSLNSYGVALNYLGTSSSFTGAANSGSCTTPTPGANQPFISVGGVTGDASEYTVPFTVDPFSSANKTIRQGYITFGGVLFYIKQTSF